VGYPKLGKSFPPQHLRGDDHPGTRGCGAHVKHCLNELVFHMCILPRFNRGRMQLKPSSRGEKLGFFHTLGLALKQDAVRKYFVK
jgi:hypothetical protein